MAKRYRLLKDLPGLPAGAITMPNYWKTDLHQFPGRSTTYDEFYLDKYPDFFEPIPFADVMDAEVVEPAQILDQSSKK